MQIKNFKYIISIAFFTGFTSSCTTIKSIGNSTKKWGNKVQTTIQPKVKKDTVSIKPGNTTLVRFSLPSLKRKTSKPKKVKSVEETPEIISNNNSSSIE